MRNKFNATNEQAMTLTSNPPHHGTLPNQLWGWGGAPSRANTWGAVPAAAVRCAPAWAARSNLLGAAATPAAEAQHLRWRAAHELALDWRMMPTMSP